MRRNYLKLLNSPLTNGVSFAGGAFAYKHVSENPDDFKLLFDRQMLASMFTIGMQPISMPILNLLVAKLNGEKYHQALFKRLSNNPADLYQSLFKNTIRRTFGSIPSSVLADFLKEKFNYDKVLTAIIATALETSLSIAVGEIQEKKNIIKSAADSYGGSFSEKGFIKNYNNGSIAAAISLRNGLFMSATFVVEPLSNLIADLTGDTFDKNKIQGALRYALTIASVVPENISNQLVMGKSISAIFHDQDSIKTLTRGALARGLYGAIASWSISTGLNIAKRIRETETFDIQDIVSVVFEQLDILLLRAKLTQEEYQSKGCGFVNKIDSAAKLLKDQGIEDYNDLAIEMSFDALQNMLHDFQNTQHRYWSSSHVDLESLQETSLRVR